MFAIIKQYSTPWCNNVKNHAAQARTVALSDWQIDFHAGRCDWVTSAHGRAFSHRSTHGSGIVRILAYNLGTLIEAAQVTEKTNDNDGANLNAFLADLSCNDTSMMIKRMFPRSLISRSTTMMLVALLFAGCAAPTVKLEAERRETIKTIAILQINQPATVRIFSQSGATAIAGAIPGLGVLGAAIAGGVSGAIAGTTGKSDEGDFNRLIPESDRQYADALTTHLAADLTANGYTVLVQPGVKLPLLPNSKEVDYKVVETTADAFVYVTYQYFGYFSPQFKDEFRPRIDFTVKVIDAKSKEVIFSDRYSLSEVNNEANGISSVGAGKLAIYPNSAELKNRSAAAYQALLKYQAFIASRFAGNFIGKWDEATVKTPLIPGVADAAQARPAVAKAARVATVPVPTGAVANVDAVPYLNERGRNDYRTWLTRPDPKAFVVSSNGHHAYAFSIHPRDPAQPTDPTERALKLCAETARQPCQVYAVNEEVVWAGALAVTVKTPVPASVAPDSPLLSNVSAVPYLSDAGREDYRAWLRLAKPRAFALSASGHYALTSGTKPKDPMLPTDPGKRALMLCTAAAKEACRLYAVNGEVVWDKLMDGASATDAAEAASVAPLLPPDASAAH